MRFATYNDLEDFIKEICTQGYVSPFSNYEKEFTIRGYRKPISMYDFTLKIGEDCIKLIITNADIPLVIVLYKTSASYEQRLISMLEYISRQHYSINLTNACEDTIQELKLHLLEKED